ncbi:hypothetical protein GQ44DRAFT_742857 [Phaeosphaeriaceae sp. PMI808]|nr:hypothetical protein GQ44DRAFT_742857 [Phaeosphaeriaceae sp. PMI808]
MSLPSAPSNDNNPHPRVALDNQGISIGPMTMMCFARLNYEAVVPIRFPSPSWTKTTEYTALQPQTYNNDDNNDVNCAFFSLNLSIYNQEVIPSDWDDTWFILSGQIDADDDTEPNSGVFNYTIALFMVRDWGYQPISPRTLNFDSIFDIIPPIVTFTSSAAGSGHTLLRGDPPSGLSETQQKCCGFVQLSTFITPGNSTRPPY